MSSAFYGLCSLSTDEGALRSVCVDWDRIPCIRGQ